MCPCCGFNLISNTKNFWVFATFSCVDWIIRMIDTKWGQRFTFVKIFLISIGILLCVNVVMLVFHLDMYPQFDTNNNMSLPIERKFVRSHLKDTIPTVPVPVQSKIPSIQQKKVDIIDSHKDEMELVEPKPIPLKPSSPYDHSGSIQDFGLSSLLLIIASNRPEYLSQNLAKVVEYHPCTVLPIVVSEDGNSPQVSTVVEKYKKEFHETKGCKVPFLHVHHPGHHEPAQNGYFRLSRHFKWALTNGFTDPNIAPNKHPFDDNTLGKVDRIIILEEDLLIATDFFNFFGVFSHILDEDTSLLCISAWNDNGFSKFIHDASSIYRSDFFPGLGWMMPRRIWNELEPKWPRAYWDDWMREPPQRKDRHTLRPEVSRTFHIGSHGVSNAEFSDYMHKIKLNDQYIHFEHLDMAYLRQEEWDNKYELDIHNAQKVTTNFFSSSPDTTNTTIQYKIMYQGLNGGPDSFVSIARRLGIMENIKANVPRTAYKGIVTVWIKNMKVHIVPESYMIVEHKKLT